MNYWEGIENIDGKFLIVNNFVLHEVLNRITKIIGIALNNLRMLKY